MSKLVPQVGTSNTMTLGGTQRLTANINAASDAFAFMGAKPSEIAQLSGTKRKIQTQLDELDASKQPKGNYALASEFKSFTIHGQHDQPTAVVQHRLSANAAQQQTTQRGLRSGFGHHSALAKPALEAIQLYR
jgi:hypothetical protein